MDVFDRLKLGRFQFFFLIGCFGYVGFSSRENGIFFNHKTQKEIQTGRENVKKKNLLGNYSFWISGCVRSLNLLMGF